jgi:putative transposase
LFRQFVGATLLLHGVPGEFCTSGSETNWYVDGPGMARGKPHTPEQIVNVLRQIEVAIAIGKTTPAACKEAGFTEQTYYRWQREYGGLQIDQARRLKELEQENAKLNVETRKKWPVANQNVPQSTL